MLCIYVYCVDYHPRPSGPSGFIAPPIRLDDEKHLGFPPWDDMGVSENNRINVAIYSGCSH